MRQKLAVKCDTLVDLSHKDKLTNLRSKKMKITIENKEYEVVFENGLPSLVAVSQDQPADMPYVMCRTYSAGVFAGYLYSRSGKEVVLKDARRIWYWAGAASLSELAERGTSRPDDCKFPCPVARVDLTEVIEIIYISEGAKQSIQGVKEWTAH